MKKVSITAQPSLLIAPGTDGSLQVKDVSGVGELFFVDTTGRAVQLTSGGAVNATVTGGGGGGVTDHGALTGLSDDDHPQYGALAQAESVAALWSFTEGLQVSKVHTSLPTASTVPNALVVLRNGSVRAQLCWSAQKADGSWAWVYLGTALP